ncbi:MAG: ribosome maturation factor RimP [Fibrobacterales bacterium]
MNTERIEELLKEIAEQVNCEMVEYTIFQAGSRQIFRIFIDAEAGITVDLCAKFSRELGTVLDLEELIDDEYVLEVSSPGIERPLKNNRDFERNIGRTLKVTFEEPIEGVTKKKFLVAELLGFSEETLTMKVKKDEVQVPREKILTAKIEIQF